MIQKLINWYEKILMGTSMSDSLRIIIENATLIIIVLLVAWLADYMVKRIIINGIKRITKKTRNEWDDILVKRGIFNRLAHLAPAIIIFFSLDFIFFNSPKLVEVLKNFTQAYMVIVVLRTIDALLNALLDIYRMLPISRGREIKSYLQVIKIIFYITAIIFIISIFSGSPPRGLLTGLGAMAAVLMLVFKDTILGFVASIQLSANNMVNLGDWISMPKYNADGDVIDISLNTVKVQNWDKTIATIPTYALVSESFNNWKGMEESGGRRIKRSINIDMNSVGFLDEAQIERVEKFFLLSDYINSKKKEISDYNTSLKVDDTVVTNGRRMTNLGTFRAYLENYLHQHPQIHQDMTFLVRQLQPSEKGIPMEIYVFSKDQAWANYEAIQADIFDHVLAILPEFGLRVFQNPSGADFNKLTGTA